MVAQLVVQRLSLVLVYLPARCSYFVVAEQHARTAGASAAACTAAATGAIVARTAWLSVHASSVHELHCLIFSKHHIFVMFLNWCWYNCGQQTLHVCTQM